ncbi:MAG: HdeA/HdeB family chaperone [Xanthobacteraceae bacterium]|jgi:acid stress chaperone HdeB
MKRCAVALAALMLAGNFAIAASAIDLSTWTCRKFQTASKDDTAIILAWLDGYYKQEDEPPVIDADQFAANQKKLNEYCADHPEAGLITAADKLFQKE